MYSGMILNNNMGAGAGAARTTNVQYPPVQARLALFERVRDKVDKSIDLRASSSYMSLSFGDTGAALDPNDEKVSRLFFSTNNVDILQGGLRTGVHHMSDGKFSIPNQDERQLMNVMNSMFSRYAHYDTNILRSVEDRVTELNTRVLDYLVPFLYNEAIAYHKYLRDHGRLVMPLPPPKQVDRDFKDLGDTRLFL